MRRQRWAEALATEEPDAFIAHVRVWGGCDTKSHEELLCLLSEGHNLMFCHQYPTKTCGWGDPAV